MPEHATPETADELGHMVFHLMTELTQTASDPSSTPDDVEAARVRLAKMHSEVHDALWDNSDIGQYDAGLRSAMMTHLHTCDSAQREPVTLVSPLPQNEVRALRAQARAIRQGLDDVEQLHPNVRERIASVFQAHADLSDVLREQGEESILVLQGLQGRAPRNEGQRIPLGDATEWHTAGRRHWALSMTTATQGDDAADCQSAYDQLDALRAMIPDLSADQCRAYLTGLLEEVEDFAWHGL